MMNYSDYDSDGYSSNEDADYVPSGEDRLNLHGLRGGPRLLFHHFVVMTLNKTAFKVKTLPRHQHQRFLLLK